MSSRILWREAVSLYYDMVGNVGSERCFRCGNSECLLETDHVVPLLRGGKNKPWNWQQLCHSCNGNKGARHEGDYRPEPFRRQLMAIGMQLDADMSEDGRWLTYDQIAVLRRIDKPSAIKLATRHRWKRRKSNRGQVQVLVPVDWFDRARDRRDKYAEKSEDSAVVTALQKAFDTALAAKDETISELRAALDRALAASATSTEALQQAEKREADLKGQGRWARLRLAWRGF
jgi:hypothetical protein